MTTLEAVTLVLAIWGAILSTILTIWEVNKEKRKLIIFFDYLLWSSTYRLTIVNNGHRPITIMGISMDITYEYVPSGAIAPGVKFPFTLEDGKFLSFSLDLPIQILTEYLEGQGKDTSMKALSEYVKVTLIDSENRKYTKYKLRELDEKWTEF